jgi:hypothetical protein
VHSSEFDVRLRDFSEQWLGVQRLEEVDRLDPEFTPELRTALREQFREFIALSLLAPDGGFSALFTSDVEPTPGLNTVYAPTGASAEAIAAGRAARRGLLGLPAVLAAKAAANGSDPVKRGMMVRITLLCEAMPPPIANADFSLVMTTEEMQTRERFEALAALTACQSCHQVINPPGYLFEQFDHLGRFRTEEKGRPVNASGTIPPFFDNAPYAGVADWHGIVPLAEWLATSAEARSCFAARFIGYVMAGDIPDGMNNCELPQVASRFVQSGRLEELAQDVVRSKLFWNRTRGDQ